MSTEKMAATELQHDNQVNASFRPNPAVCGGGLNGSDSSLLLTKQEVLAGVLAALIGDHKRSLTWPLLRTRRPSRRG